MVKLHIIKQREFKHFAQKWKVAEESVEYVFYMLEQLSFRYGKAAKILKKQNFDLTPRQLKYFTGRIKLSIRLGGNHPANYSEMLRKKT